MQKTALILTSVLALTACAGKKTEVAASDDVAPEVVVNFDADSAYSYVERQVAFGPRVPNTEAHRRCGEWLASELRRRGADVTEQRSDLTAFDGTVLKAVNILGRFNTESPDRLLLLAHWDCRPWADQDPNPDNRKKPVEVANDCGIGVVGLHENARQVSDKAPGKSVDNLFVDAEDWGNERSDDAWELGERYFMEHPPVEGYLPDEAILLDMVGGKGAVFCREYFSEQAAPRLAQSLWGIAASRGYGDLFLNKLGGAVTDDHVQLIEKGVPAVDIIEYHPEQESGFNPHWHTVSDNMENIDRATLKAVGETVMQYLITNY